WAWAVLLADGGRAGPVLPRSRDAVRSDLADAGEPVRPAGRRALGAAGQRAPGGPHPQPPLPPIPPWGTFPTAVGEGAFVERSWSDGYWGEATASSASHSVPTGTNVQRRVK